ncbi:hypothetical protein BpJC7_10730 [Weizmannia acidilactici]|uniref:Anti-sigma-W factor RsiW n=1 Tax=Weizmannia acidilactici TaxID=2607726 RepID=A0A5J4JGY8_9BACI|nr:zf-HC2 domain-containing protein [Weizmannia acidilactici]GER65902.1 hypothetical protein BpJC4_03730 [Weizmannia acidilactici]GER69770.1 hypothetical protein BpJC7_10730 [Weizmannia acidilactici]GER73195.1 hypothetical protein BpPP18_12620 [Weizmannia acidilactici]
MEEHVQDLLSAFMDDELNNEERKMVESHLSVCPLCRQELEELQAVQAKIKQFYDSVELPGFQFEKAVMSKIYAEENLVMNYRVFIWFFAVCILVAGFAMYPVLRKPFYVGMDIASGLANIVSSGFHIALSILSALPNLSAAIMIATSVILAVCLWLVISLLKMKPVKE